MGLANSAPTSVMPQIPITQGLEANSLNNSTFSLLSLFFGALEDGDDEERNQRWSSFIGIVVAICGNILISFALNIQRYAHVRIEQEAEGERVRLRSRRCVSGSTYGSVDIPYRDDVDCGNATGVNGEQNTQEFHNDRYQSYSDNEERDAEPDNMGRSVVSDRTLRADDKLSIQGDRASYLHSPYWWTGIVLMTLGEMGNFLAYGFAPASIVSPLGVVALISNCIIAPFILKEKFRRRDLCGVLIAIAGAVVVVLSAETSETKIGPHDIWVMITKWEFELYLGLTAALIIVLMYLSEKYGGRTILIDLGLVGLFGGYTALSTKGVASLLSFTLWHVITFPISYLLIAVLVSSALMQIRYINRALQRFDSTQVIPIQFVLFTLSVIIGSAVLYRDFESATTSRALKFVGGCGLTFLGVYFITSDRTSDEDDISYGDEDEEAEVGFLHGEQYRDSIDEPSVQGQRLQKPNDTGVSDLNQLRSSRISVQSSVSEGQSLNTPRGLLSPVGSDHEGSLSADSLSQELGPSSPPIQSETVIDNPWVSSGHTSQIQSQSNSLRDNSPATPATPPSRQPHVQTPPLLLRFPAAPTSEDNLSSTNAGHHNQSNNSLRLPSDIKAYAQRRRSTPRTPQSSSRNSVSLRLTPSPLLTPLSSTLLADSLLRSEAHSIKHQRSKSVRVRRLAAAPLLPDSANSENQSSDSVPDSHNAESRPPESTVVSARTRSFSDSIGGPLAWLGGTLFRGKSSRPALPPQPSEDEPGAQNTES